MGSQRVRHDCSNLACTHSLGKLKRKHKVKQPLFWPIIPALVCAALKMVRRKWPKSTVGRPVCWPSLRGDSLSKC